MVVQRRQKEFGFQNLRGLYLPSVLKGTDYVHLKCVPKRVYFSQGLYNSVKNDHV